MCPLPTATVSSSWVSTQFDRLREFVSLRTEHKVQGLQDINTHHALAVHLNFGARFEHVRSVNAVLDGVSIFLATLALLAVVAALHLFLLTIQLTLVGLGQIFQIILGLLSYGIYVMWGLGIYGILNVTGILKWVKKKAAERNTDLRPKWE